MRTTTLISLPQEKRGGRGSGKGNEKYGKTKVVARVARIALMMVSLALF